MLLAVAAGTVGVFEVIEQAGDGFDSLKAIGLRQLLLASPEMTRSRAEAILAYVGREAQGMSAVHETVRWVLNDRHFANGLRLRLLRAAVAHGVPLPLKDPFDA